jgi:tRNA pseudouridine55 synthase
MARARRCGRPVHGWLCLDKPAGMTSTEAVARVRRLTQALKVGHGGTLDPLATGVLPIALGEATKTVAYVMAGRKCYRFTARWGEARSTDDAEGEVLATSTERPSAAAIEAALPGFVGTLEQVPPRYAAIKVAGKRAYDLARRGEPVELAPRTVEIERPDIGAAASRSSWPRERSRSSAWSCSSDPILIMPSSIWCVAAAPMSGR